MVVFVSKALSTLATTVAEFGDSRRKRRRGDYSRLCAQGIVVT